MKEYKILTKEQVEEGLNIIDSFIDEMCLKNDYFYSNSNIINVNNAVPIIPIGVSITFISNLYDKNSNEINAYAIFNGDVEVWFKEIREMMQGIMALI